MRGLLLKIYMETRWPVLLFGAGLSIIMAILTWVLPNLLTDLTALESMPLIKPVITALLGIDPDSQFSAQMTQAFLWVHPSVLATMWGHAVMYCTRTPAGEIDRGTVDFLLGLPVSRWKLHIAESIGGLISGVLLFGTGLIGHFVIADRFAEEMRPSITSIVMIFCNMLSMYIAVATMTMLVSSLSDHRNRAIGVVFAILLLSFLLNFLAQFWKPARSWGRLSILEYYRPANIIQSGVFPWTNVGILLLIGLVCWTTAGIVLKRRSICTV